MKKPEFTISAICQLEGFLRLMGREDAGKEIQHYLDTYNQKVDALLSNTYHNIPTRLDDLQTMVDDRRAEYNTALGNLRNIFNHYIEGINITAAPAVGGLVQ